MDYLYTTFFSLLLFRVKYFFITQVNETEDYFNEDDYQYIVRGQKRISDQYLAKRRITNDSRYQHRDQKRNSEETMKRFVSKLLTSKKSK